MIIASNFKLEVGKIHKLTISDQNGVYVKAIFLILREATREEYVNENLHYKNLEQTNGYNSKYFYEGSTD